MDLLCIRRFSSSSGVFFPGDIVSGKIALQVMNESPDSFEVIQPAKQDEIRPVEIVPMDKSIRKVKLARKDSSNGDN
ncbi:MAG: hypothetical protein ACO3EZ_03265 [Prochlorotrichaceae cyanobacterium]|jgi:hypothetical protein